MPISARHGTSIRTRSFRRLSCIGLERVRSQRTSERSSRLVCCRPPETRSSHMRALIRFAVRRPKLIVGLWILVLAAAAPFASRLAGALRGSTDAVPGSPSEVVSRQLNDAFGEGSAFMFPVVLTSGVAASDARFAIAAVRLERALDSAGLTGVRHYWN